MAGRATLEHRLPTSMHEDAAERHEWAAQYWEERGLMELAALERRHADNERDAAGLVDRTRALGDPGSTEQ